jgi:hypothetical protein
MNPMPERRTSADRRKVRKVRKAIFPAAGLGTRFLPATKAQPKEMLPLVDKPIIQYGVEEALAAGCDQIIIITGRGKSAIEDHFDVSYELEKMLEEKGKHDLLKIVRQISDMIYVAYVRQKEALGLGHAVLTARELIGDEPFATLLADDVIDARVPVLKQLMNVFDEKHCSVIATQIVDGPAISSYGGRGHGRQTVRGSRPGGKTEVRRCAFESGRDRALHSDTGDLRNAFEHQAGRGRRTATHGRAARVAAARKAVCLRLRRPPLRYWRQTRLPESDG